MAYYTILTMKLMQVLDVVRSAAQTELNWNIAYSSDIYRLLLLNYDYKNPKLRIMRPKHSSSSESSACDSKLHQSSR